MNKKIKERRKEEMTEKEKCVLCSKETEYYRNTPIDKRKHYVEGSGQLCDDCGNVMGVE
jgi:hypothetical protein